MATCPNCGNGLTEQANFCPSCGKALRSRPPAEEFRIVTIMFCDVVKSTDLERELEPQPMQRLLNRYGQAVRRELGGRGASVGKRHGDGFMAAFGVPELHEDDALRAVVAAGKLRAAVARLNDTLQDERDLEFHVRIGINTGNVLVRDAGTLEEELTGIPVNLAKRFEEAAGAGEILLGRETYRLVEDVVRAEPVGPLTVRGAAEPQNIWRLLEILPDRPGRPRRPITPMVGRGLERDLLKRLFDRVLADQSCHMVNVLGSAGVGKSRLVDEFVDGLMGQARILRAHCPTFGDSVTLWPIVEIVRQAAGIDPTEPPDQARARLTQLLGGEERGDLLTERVAQLVGFGQEAGLPEDTLWALQRLLETVARRMPLVLIIDDLHWADQILLDAIEHVVEYVEDAPVMLICMARPDELFARSMKPPSGYANIVSLKLAPLPETEAEQLVGYLLSGRVDAGVQAHVSEWAQGFPLLVEELVANLREEGRLRSSEGRWVLRLEPKDAAERPSRPIPMKIQAMMLSRLGRLGTVGRAVIEPAAVVGQKFHLGDLQPLVPQSSAADLAAGVQELVRLDLVRPDHEPASVPLPPNSGPGYRFRHATIKTVAYERLPDDRRAELHERYADWLERETTDRRSQFDEIVGHHFYEAYRYARRLEPATDHTRELASRAGERYAAAGGRAAVRGDSRVVQAWLGRATRLLPADHPVRLRALAPLAEVLQRSGQQVEAARAYEELARSASAVGDADLASHATIGRLRLTALHEPGKFLKDGREQIDSVISEFDSLGDAQGLAKAWHLLAYLDWSKGRLAVAGVAAERARAFAKQANDRYWEATILGLHFLILYWGPTSLDEVDKRVREALAEAQVGAAPSLEATALTVLARIAALRGDLDDAQELVRSAEAVTVELDQSLTRAAGCISQALIDVCSDDLVAAEDALRTGYKDLERMGDTGPLASVAVMLARVRLLRGDADQAEEFTRTCERIAAAEQLDAQVRWRSIRAIALARRGEADEAERLVRDAVHMVGMTDQLDSRAEAHVDLAEVLRLGGRDEEAKLELERAVKLYQRKGNRVGERNARRQLVRISR